ncbi:hypothetical protein B0O80DRAFT_484924 [Mortierella sp. GBAus27b]|nr:hypothetical protein B0O80DRAFT_484924 [Mortierella sp. GBAus27b]
MATTQSFRLAGSTDTEEILCNHVDGQSVVYWEDIEQVFPGIKHVKNGRVTVSLMRDSNRNRITPHCMQYHPGVILDVVLSNTAGVAHIEPLPTAPTPLHVDEPSGTSSVEELVESLQVSSSLTDSAICDTTISASSSALPPSQPTSLRGSSRLSFSQVVKLAQRRALESEIEQQLMSSFSTDIQKQVRVSSVYGSMVQAIKDGQVEQSDRLMACLLELKTEIAKNAELTMENNKKAAQILEMQASLDSKQDEMKQLQIQALDRVALLHKQVQAVLTQTYELHEYPIPRLFVVLPQDQSRWDYLNPFANKFRLYFLCECGEHTKSINSKIPHHIHLARHEGYEISRPSEFFEQYGSYVLTILRMLKFGISVAGVVVPAVSHLFPSDAIDEVTKDLKSLKETVGTGMDKVIKCIERASRDEGSSIDDFMDPTGNNEALEGADLRKLDTFLKNKDENKVLGNLYRTVTSEGHVKWVCIDHYRDNYQSKAVQSFRDVVASLHGSFDENTGRVKVTLSSKVQASQFYSALEKAKSVYELEIGFGDWYMTYNDFKDLRDALYKTNIGVLVLDRVGGTNIIGDVLNLNRQFNPFFDIMRHSSIKSIRFDTPEVFFARSNLLSRNDDFSNLRHLEVTLYFYGENTSNLSYLRHLLSKTPNLKSLTLQLLEKHILEIYNGIVEYQTYPIEIKKRSSIIEDFLYIPYPKSESDSPLRSLKDLDLLLNDMADGGHRRMALVGHVKDLGDLQRWLGDTLVLESSNGGRSRD